MAWNVDQIYSFLKYQIKKNQAGGLKRTDFMFAWNSEQSAFQADLLGRFQRISNGKSGLNTGLIENETIMTTLTPFTQTTPLTINAGQGFKPADFVYTLAIRINGAKAFQIPHDMIWAVNQDVIDPPSVAEDQYYYTEYQNYYSFLPNTVTAAQLDYIQVVTDIVWGFKLDVNNKQVYDAGSSTQPLWGQNAIVEITKRCLKSLGVSFKDNDFQNFGQSNITTGD